MTYGAILASTACTFEISIPSVISLEDSMTSNLHVKDHFNLIP
jgi:hypothetical protein